MRPARTVALYLVAVFLGGAILAPVLYNFVQAAAVGFPALSKLAGKPFTRYVDRSMLLVGVVCLWSLLKSAGLCSRRAIGFAKRRDWPSQMGWGLLVGLMSFGGIIFVTLAFGARVPAHPYQGAALMGHIAKAVGTAAVVAGLEEIIFRGVLFGALRRQFAWPLALILSSLIYAVLHFPERPEPVRDVVWSSGLTVLGSMAASLGEMDQLVPRGLNLMLAGLTLGLAYQRTGSLHFSIGMHAGWILLLKINGFLTERAGAQDAWFFGTAQILQGWLAFAVLAGLFVLLSRMSQESPNSDRAESSLEGCRAS